MHADVLVTGGTGFVGANLVRRLVELGIRPHVTVRPGSNLYRIEDILERIVLVPVQLTDYDVAVTTLLKVSPRIIVHVAAYAGHPCSGRALLDAIHVNVSSTAAICEVALEASTARLIYVGSSLEYVRSDTPMDESLPVLPDTPRGLAKALATQIVEYYARVYGLPATIARLFSVYGPWEHPERFIPRLVRAALAGTPVRLTQKGLRHDWIHVQDVVDLLITAMETTVPPGSVFNVGSGIEWTNEEVVALIEEVLGRKLNVASEKHPAGRHDRPHWRADVSKARDVLGWSPSIPLRDGLEQTARWWRERIARAAA